jgi:hypothetical protein
VKSRRRDADDGGGLAIHTYRAADYPDITIQSLFPELIAKYGDQASRSTTAGCAVVAGENGRAPCHVEAENTEVVARDQQAGDIGANTAAFSVWDAVLLIPIAHFMRVPPDLRSLVPL